MLNGLFPLSVPSCLRGKRYAADLEIGDTAGLETCATFTNGNGSPHSQMRPLCHAGNEPSFLRSASALRLGFRLLFLLPWLCLLGLGSGCQTATPSLFTASGPGWHVQQGQALWRPKQGLPEFGGDLVLAGDDTGRHLIQFDKTPLTMMSAQVTSNRWRIQFPQQSLSFSGSGSGSTHFLWLYLPPALAGRPLPRDLRFERQPDGGWRLENRRTGELVEGYLAP
jgi:hypothetical protein